MAFARSFRIKFLSSCTATRMYRGRNMGIALYTLLPGLNSPSDGRFIFEESRSLAEQSALLYSVALTGSYQKWGDTIMLRTAAELFVNRHLVNPQDNFYYGHLDSSESSLLPAHQFEVSSVNIKDTNSFDNFHTTLYYPAAIHLNLADYIPMGFDHHSMIQGSSLRPAQTLIYNADPQNTRGGAIKWVGPMALINHKAWSNFYQNFGPMGLVKSPSAHVWAIFW